MTDFSTALRELSEPWPRGDKVKSAIQRAARLAGLSYWRAFDIWYGKARRIEADEAERIAEALRRKTEEAARNELQELRTRLIRLESILVQSDPDFHRTDIDLARAPRRVVDGMAGASNRAVAPAGRQG